MGSPWCPVPQIHVWGAESPPKARAGIGKATRTQRRGPGPAQRDLVNRVRSGRKQLSAGPLVCRRVAWSEPATRPALHCVESTAGARSAFVSHPNLRAVPEPVAPHRYAPIRGGGGDVYFASARVDDAAAGACPVRSTAFAILILATISVLSFPSVVGARPTTPLTVRRSAHPRRHRQLRLRRAARLGDGQRERHELEWQSARGLLAFGRVRPTRCHHLCNVEHRVQ